MDETLVQAAAEKGSGAEATLPCVVDRLSRYCCCCCVLLAVFALRSCSKRLYSSSFR